MAGRLEPGVRDGCPLSSVSAPSPAVEHVDIGWTDEFVRQIRSYVAVRQADELLILLPNQAYKLNRTGLELLGRMLDGESVFDVLGPHADDRAKCADVHHFFCDLRALLVGCLGEGEGRRAVETVPFRRPYNLLPVLSEVAVTYRCNLSCLFCYASCSCHQNAERRHLPVPHGGGRAFLPACSDRQECLPSGRQDGSQPVEMSTDQVKRIFDIIRHQAQVPSTSFTGGEPMLRNDIVELLGHAKAAGLRVNLITNGTLIDAQAAQALRGAGLDSAQVSLEGVTAATHDGLAQVRGSFEASLRGVEHLRRAGVTVHTNTTATRANLTELAELPALMKGLGLDRFSMNMVIPCGSAGPGAEGLWVSYSEIGEVVREVKRAARRVGVQFLWYSPTPYCIFNPVAEGLGNKGCAACDGLLSVAPNGDVLPCSSLAQPVGNLLTQPFEEVWGGERARFYQEKRYAHEVCQSCELFDMCDGACPIYWKIVGYGELLEVKAHGQVLSTRT